jgi:mannose-6-phosphate isomerase-like protein (cupin superfamily)
VSVEEARLEDRGAGLVATTTGWFVLNARDARWFERPGRGASVPLTGADEYEAETFFPQLGMAIRVIGPGEPSTTYHWETEQEDFLVLRGEALLLVDGEERPVKQWDFVHCPPETRHAFVGAGEEPCVLLAVSSREFQAQGPWGWYCADGVAVRHGAAPPETTQDTEHAYSHLPPGRETRYRNGLLPNLA